MPEGAVRATAEPGVHRRATAPADALDRIELKRKADIALYSAKAAGRGRYVAFADTMDASLRQRRAIEQDLRTALLAKDQLKVHFQPLYAAAGGEIAGVEALARWLHPRDGLKSPALFIPIAEESGLIAARRMDLPSVPAR